jgi:7-keto-8-aminopelargonate synthetase-like enzyme
LVKGKTGLISMNEKNNRLIFSDEQDNLSNCETIQPFRAAARFYLLGSL